MLTIYTVAGCNACRKVKQWLRASAIEFTEISIFSVLLDAQRTTELFSVCTAENVAFINENSPYLHALYPNFDDLSEKEKIVIALDNPSIINRPLIVAEPSFYRDNELPDDWPHNVISKCTADCANFPLCAVSREN